MLPITSIYEAFFCGIWTGLYRSCPTNLNLAHQPHIVAYQGFDIPSGLAACSGLQKQGDFKDCVLVSQKLHWLVLGEATGNHASTIFGRGRFCLCITG